MNLNPIFEEVAQKGNQLNFSAAIEPAPKDTSNAPAKPSTKQMVQRKTRSDKTHDMRFPVTAQQKALIRRQAKANNLRETKYTTQLLLEALKSCTSLPDYDYKDTRLYMHVKPTQAPYKQIFELAIASGKSERETVARLVMHVLYGGGAAYAKGIE